MTLSQKVVDDALQRCPISLSDPDSCDNEEDVEIDRDGDHDYFECPDCGFAWGWRPAEDGGVRIDASCQAGIPVDVRMAVAGSQKPPELGAPAALGMPSIRRG